MGVGGNPPVRVLVARHPCSLVQAPAAGVEDGNGRESAEDSGCS